jgi:hypothetical protein
VRRQKILAGLTAIAATIALVCGLSVSQALKPVADSGDAAELVDEDGRRLYADIGGVERLLKRLEELLVDLGPGEERAETQPGGGAGEALAQPVKAGGLDSPRGLRLRELRRATALEGDHDADEDRDDGDEEPDEQLRGQRQVLQGLQRSPPRRGAVLNHGLGSRLWGRGQLTFTVTRRETPGSGMVTP